MGVCVCVKVYSSTDDNTDVCRPYSVAYKQGKEYGRTKRGVEHAARQATDSLRAKLYSKNVKSFPSHTGAQDAIDSKLTSTLNYHYRYHCL